MIGVVVSPGRRLCWGMLLEPFVRLTKCQQRSHPFLPPRFLFNQYRPACTSSLITVPKPSPSSVLVKLSKFPSSVPPYNLFVVEIKLFLRFNYLNRLESYIFENEFSHPLRHLRVRLHCLCPFGPPPPSPFYGSTRPKHLSSNQRKILSPQPIQHRRQQTPVPGSVYQCRSASACVS